MSNLTLLKASAGSGKTYQLALKYLEHLMEDPFSYRKILAVTFTNKASNEMKERIISSLYLLSKNDPKVAGYKESLLKSNPSFTESSLAEKAHKTLEIILNDYSAFSVGTIDRFFQWVIRGFTREIGLQTGYNLELNPDNILNEAIERILLSLDTDGQIKEWILDYTQEKLLENKNWKIETYLFELGREIFSENYQEVMGENRDKDEDRKNLLSLRSKLYEIIRTTENKLKVMAAAILQIAEEKGFAIEDFKRKSTGVLGYLKGVAEASRDGSEPTDTVKKAAGDPLEWVAKTHKSREAILELVTTRLQKRLIEYLEFWEGNKAEYLTAIELQKNIYTFGLLKDISSSIREICLENNIFLLSDSSFFLKKIIEGNDTPFIFEKAGNYFDKYMLDEFQDTSRFQWDNFYPLIVNGLSEDQPSLIVGDVKQSIYRWRNGDWRILAAEVNQRVHKHQIREEYLRVNYRSSKNLVRFFNSFFTLLPKKVQSTMRQKWEEAKMEGEFLDNWLELVDRVYDNTEQELPEGSIISSGYVESQFFFKKNQDQYREFLEQRIPELVENLQERGIRPRDITFLVRTKAEGRIIAEMLLSQKKESQKNYNYSIISNDALYIGNNPSVRFLLGMLKKISGQSEKINDAYLNHALFYFFNTEVIPSNPHLIFSSVDEDSLRFKMDFYLEERGIQNEQLQKLPLFELLEELIRIFDLGKNSSEIAYLQAFQDFVLNYLNEETGDISSFLRYWDIYGDDLMLNASEAQDAMRIMTIHKAKGLQFKTVIIPFCDWALTPGTRNNMIWVNPEGTPFHFFPMLPVNYSRKLSDTMFHKEYWNETFMGYIDNINLLYVSFTRAEKELYTFSGITENANEISIGTLLLNILKGSGENGAKLPGGVYSDENNFFTFGEKEQLPIPEKKSGNYTSFPENYPVHNSTPTLLKNNRNIYLSSLEEEFSDPAGFGTQMHEIFSMIITEEDIEPAVRKAWMKGLLSTGEKDDWVAKIKGLILENPFKQWFDGEGEVITEQDLVDESGNILRPDRVVVKDGRVMVIDFKFGDKERDSYLKQVQRYVMALEAAGYKNVRGYVWYPLLKRMREAG